MVSGAGQNFSLFTDLAQQIRNCARIEREYQWS
jgi:hypothetical protein